MIDLTLDYIKERELLLKEIEKLREERNQLRKVLLDVLAKEYVADCKDVARAALGEKKDG